MTVTATTVQYLLGDFVELAAYSSIQRPRHTVAETAAAIDVTAPDHLQIIGRLKSGAVVSVHLHDGEVGQPRSRIEIAGTAGDLEIVSAHDPDPWAAQIQISELELRNIDGSDGRWRAMAIPESYRMAEPLPTQAVNVAQVYTRLAEDIRAGTHHAPDFEAGLRLHRLLQTVQTAATTGIRQLANPLDRAPY